MRADGRRPEPGEAERRGAEAARAGRYGTLSRAAAFAALALGLAVLAGWALNEPVLIQVGRGYAPMPPLAAVDFVVGGLALLLSRPADAGRARRAAGAALAGVLTLLSLANVAHQIAGDIAPLGNLLFPAAVAASPWPDPWPATSTALAFSLIGLALLTLALRVRAGDLATQVLALAAAFLALHTLVLYIYDINVLIGRQAYTPMALHSALGVLVLALGILLARPDRGLMRTVTAEDIGGDTARKLLPVALAAPLLFGLARVPGLEARLFGPVLGITLALTLSIAALVALVWWTARAVHRLEQARMRALERAELTRVERERAAARLRLALEAAQVGTWDWDVRTGAVTWSRELEAIYGSDPELVPRSVEELWQAAHPEDRARVRAAIERALESGESYHLEFRTIRPDGAVRWVEMWGTVFRSAQGEPAHMACLCRDVTERVEEARAKARLAEIVESSDDAIAWGDLDGTIRSWNRAGERLYGYTAAEMVGESAYKLAPPGREGEIATILDRLRRGERIENFETVRRTKDGQDIDVSLTVSPVRDAAGRVIGWSIIARDITAQKQAEAERERLLAREREAHAAAEAARREAERHTRQETALRRAAEALTETYSPDEVIRQIADAALEATGADGAFVLRLDRELRDLRVAAAAGTHVPALGQHFPYRGSATESVLERGGVESENIPGSRDTGLPEEVRRSCGRCHAIIVPLVDSGEEIGSLILVRVPERRPFGVEERERADTFAHLTSLALRKIHLLEEAERGRKEMEQLLESRGRLTRGFSHDVKNPLGAAEGQLALLEEGVLDHLAPRQREGVQRARSSIRTAIRLIDSLVELARAEAGRLAVELEPTDVRGVVQEVVEEYRSAAEAKGLEVETRLAEELPIIRSDVDRIRQILANMIVNAVKYTEHGRITVVAKRGEGKAAAPGPGRWMVVEVSDTGPGIPQGMQEAVFGEFIRLEPGPGRGAGLGLAISRRLARLLGGDITLRSEPGKGSTFTLWLPRDLPAGFAPREAAARAPDHRPPPRRHLAADGPPSAAGASGGSPDGCGSAEEARLRALVEELRRRLDEHELLASATATLTSSLDYVETLEQLARLAVPRLADLCIVDVASDTRKIRRVAVVHRDPAREELADRLHGFAPDPARSPLGRVLFNGRPRIIPHVDEAWLRTTAESDEHLRVLRALQPRSAILVPLGARGRVLGLLSLFRTEVGRSYDQDDLRLAEELGRRASIAADNARLYEAAQAASQAKSDFLAVMSHELRTPLTAIIGYEELLERGLAGRVTDEQLRYLRRISVSALHLRELIEEILTFSRLESAREAVRLEHTDVARLARETADVIEPVAREKELTFDVVLPSEPLEAETDPAKLRRVLLNLLNNAVSFTDEGGIRFTLERSNDTAIFRIRDTGIGIATESLERIFEPFWQEQRGLTREVGGTGLGLTVARRLARMLGGDVTVTSEIGKGSTFTVRLPLRPPAPPRAGESPQRESRAPPG
ncbi:MAG TPA: ATP-binding protein [Longimicrobiales bacterium]